MAKFLIQTENNEIIHDFTFHLREAIKYQNWICNEQKHTYIYSENGCDVLVPNIKEYIPIGSIKFVLNFYKEYYNINNIKPINIPKELTSYDNLKRTIISYDTIKNDIEFYSREFFIKQIDKFKGVTGIMKLTDIKLDELIQGEFLLSDIIDIKSEWRGFVYRGELLDIKNYSGNFALFPDIQKVKNIIKEYKNSPKSYTIDVGITDKKDTVLIEIHQFFSCGLYGFCDYRYLPQMFIGTHNEIISKGK
jgi:hypothetical protein